MNEGELLDLEEAYQLNSVMDRRDNLNEQLKKKALGYTRGWINNQVLSRVLMDPGNMAANAISESLVNLLDLPVTTRAIELGVAGEKMRLQIVGEVTISFRLEGVPTEFQETFGVVRNLSHCMNLGWNFLAKYNATTGFGYDNTVIKLRGGKIELKPTYFDLNMESKDPVFSEVLELCGQIEEYDFVDFKNKVGKIRNRMGEVKQHLGKLRMTRRAKIGKHQISTLDLDVDIPNKYVFVNRVESSDNLTNKELFLLEGIYPVNEGKLTINIMNLANEDRVLRKRENICHIYDYEESLKSVNHLDHRPATELRAKDKEERVEYIKKELKLDDNKIMTAEEKTKVIDMFLNNFDAVSVSGSDFGRTDLVKFEIKLKPGSQPVRAKVRPLNPDQHADLKRQIREWQEAGVIEPADGPWASALVPAKKKGSDKLRWCVDYRRINDLTIKNAFPLPHLQANLEKLSGACIFSSLDSAGAYHNITVEPSSRPYTAFISPEGLWQFCQMPFGLSNSPSQYSLLVSLALQRLGSEFVICYLDDILIFSKSRKEHLYHLEQVLKAHVKAGLKLNLKKCQLFQDRLVYLGHLVSRQGIEMVPEYVEKILQWPIPTTGKELRQMLGFFQYYATFIEGYANMTAPLNALRAHNGKIDLDEIQLESLAKLKHAFTTAPVRAYPDFSSSNPFILETDYSSTGIGALLKQKQGDSEKIIACISRKCSTAEANYPSYKGEALALVWAIGKFEHLCAYRKFIVRTDSTFNTFLKNTKMCKGILFRWLMYLQEFEFEVEYIKGPDNGMADALSRIQWPLKAEFLPTNEELEVPGDVNVTHDKKDEYPNLEKEYLLENRFRFHQLTDLSMCMVKDVLTFYKPGERTQAIKRLGPLAREWLSQAGRLTIKDDMLYYLSNPDDLAEAKFCVPRSLIYELCEQAHRGHGGVQQTYEKLNQFYWPRMFEMIKDFVMSCDTCTGKFKHNPSQVKVYHREIIGVPLERVYLDHVGKLPTAKYMGSKVSYLLTILDHATRFLVAIPLKTLEAEETVEKFIRMFVLKYGIPSVIHTDNGRSFCSKLFADMCKTLGVVHTKTVPYNPQGNAYLERVHGQFKSIFRAESSAWTEHVDLKTYMYNQARNRITGMVPFLLFFGRIPNGPMNLKLPGKKSTDSRFSYLLKLQDNFEKVMQESVQRQVDVTAKIQEYYKNHTKKFSMGEKVWYLDPKAAGGVINRWSGPHLVIGLKNENTYEVLSRDSRRVILCPTHRLRRHLPREDFLRREGLLPWNDIEKPGGVRDGDSDSEDTQKFEFDFSDSDQDPDPEEIEAERSIESDAHDASSEASVRTSGQGQSDTSSECSETRFDEPDQDAPDSGSEDDRRPVREAAGWAAAKIQEDAWNKRT